MNKLKNTWLGILVTDLHASFKNTPGGFSARKCTAFLCTLVAAYVTYKHANDDNVYSLTTLWLASALLCLGIITAEQLIKFKNGNDGNNKGTGTAA